uniref:BUB1 N-terminal domain-containing protein n=1 Tax=Sphaeramia orbicularis TaxID=375764 RepID=A0A672Y9E1_9TELE
ISYQDPIALFSHVFSKGVGTRTAAFYMAWAQQFEQKSMNEQADVVYQKALENQAQPTDAVLHHYRLEEVSQTSAKADQCAPSPPITTKI